MTSVVSDADPVLQAQAERTLSAVPTGLLIAGVWTESNEGSTIHIENPATGQRLARVCDAKAADGIRALDAAASAQARWAETSPSQRSDFLRRAHNRLLQDIEAFAALITLEMGKSLTEARAEVKYAADFLRWFSEEASRIQGRYQRAPSGGLHHLISHRPVGPALLITPWNFPLAMIARKVGPALAAGCTMVVKPSELTPLTALFFAEAMRDLGLPNGVLNVITTSNAPGVVEPLIADPRLRKLSFTGSTRVGKILLAHAAQSVLRCSMELGGNAPFIVFEDADMDRVIDGALFAKMRNIGQACTAANRFFVHESRAEEFGRRIASAVDALPIGNGMTETAVTGPLITGTARRNMQDLVQSAVVGGARLLAGGEVVPGPGNYFRPVVLADPPADAAVLHTEIFGPILPICTFRTEAEVIDRANDTPYGLAAYAFTEDLSRGHRLAARIEAGMLGLNTGQISDPAAPFGGVKHSGIGREGSVEGVMEYLNIQYAGLAISAA
ncbi:NAD-dependent succinate-semialdehyde dehydrogenase [Tritonibacter mobilis]|nr:NAD-dependent succinate-semialdehyde dehydrogenase [Tritonibacter mobilis]